MACRSRLRVQVQLYSLFNLSARWGGGWSGPRPCPFTPGKSRGAHCKGGCGELKSVWKGVKMRKFKNDKRSNLMQQFIYYYK